MKILKEVLRRNRAAILLFFVINAFQLTVFLLYGVMIEPMLYSSIVSLLMTVCLLTVDCFREGKHREERLRAVRSVAKDWKSLPEAHSLAEEDYRGIVGSLGSRMDEMMSEYEAQRTDQLDYYTAWVHQIKTPIAVMKLKLSGDSTENRLLLAELLRIEQYVDMVMTYLKLESEDLDYVIREHDLDDIIRPVIRNFAGEFISRKIGLEYDSVKYPVLTDDKWLAFVLEQIISNALKYTKEGTICIYMELSSLCISDTGIGIAEADLPRIFEKGFTGYNGRRDKRASGIGLYLCKRICDNLGHPISAQSTAGKGTTIRIDLKRNAIGIE